jgi:broad specificity phosphatase PhoE
MRLIIFRHGNTFAAGEKVFWVGKSQDLPLVEQGKIQAQNVASVLSEFNIYPEAIYCSTLKRTKEFAQIIKKNAKFKSAILEDNRLDELDYGSWSGLSSEEIAAKGWVVDLQQWNDRCVWPEDAEWEGSADVIRSEVEDFIQDLRATYAADSTVIAVTSNGRVRYFLSLDEAAFKEAIRLEQAKVKTGHASIFNVSSLHVTLEHWNLSPTQLAAALNNYQEQKDDR